MTRMTRVLNCFLQPDGTCEMSTHPILLILLSLSKFLPFLFWPRQNGCVNLHWSRECFGLLRFFAVAPCTHLTRIHLFDCSTLFNYNVVGKEHVKQFVDSCYHAESRPALLPQNKLELQQSWLKDPEEVKKRLEQDLGREGRTHRCDLQRHFQGVTMLWMPYVVGEHLSELQAAMFGIF